MIVYYLLSGEFPFSKDQPVESRRKLLTGSFHFYSERWNTRSREVINFIEHLLVVNPANRMSAEEALNHDWIKLFSQANPTNEIDPLIGSTPLVVC